MRPYYADELVTLYHGDSCDVLPSLGLFDLVVTDPPYAASRTRGGSRGGASWRTRHGSVVWPTQEYEMTDRVIAAVALAAHHVRIGGHMVVICGSAGRAVEAMIGAVCAPHLPLMRVLPWIQPNNKNGAIGPFGWQPQVVLVFGKNYGHPRAEGFLVVERQYRAGRRLARVHPAQMPADVGRWLARALADAGTTVLDPFVGSGALLQGFLERSCRVTGIDAEARWAELARRTLTRIATPHDLWPAESA